MPAPVPVLGYRSKSQAIAALHESGLSYAEIGEKLGMTAKAVYGQARSVHSRQLEAARKGGRIASDGPRPARRAAHWAEDGHAPEGPFTYAAPRTSSLIDEIAARAAARPARREFRLLLRADGAWLDEAGLGFVFDRDRAGRFTAAEIARMRARNPARRDLREERA